MNYQVITDEQALRDFIDFLPDLEDHEKYYFCLFARSKYCKNEDGTNQLVHIKSDKAQLKRGTSDKERLFHKIKQLEVPLGAYRQRALEIPQEALALYITPNPRDMYKASVNTMVKLAHSIRDQNVMMNPHQEALSEIQKAKSRSKFVVIDYDNKDITVDELEQDVTALVGGAAFSILETRGGYHVLIEPDTVPKALSKSWYNGFKGWKYVDQMGDIMIPVPGCIQGMFTPKLTNC